MRKLRNLLLVAAAGLALGGTGCTPFSPGFYPFSMGIFTPIPVPPWVTERMQEKYEYKNDFRTAILPPIRPGFPPPQRLSPHRPQRARSLHGYARLCRRLRARR